TGWMRAPFASHAEWSRDGRLGSGDGKGRVTVWIPGAEDQPCWEVRGHEKQVYAIAWSSAGRLASCAADGSVAVWLPEGRHDPFHRYVHGCNVTGLAWSRDGRLAFGDEEGKVAVWTPGVEDQPCWQVQGHEK